MNRKEQIIYNNTSLLLLLFLLKHYHCHLKILNYFLIGITLLSLSSLRNVKGIVITSVVSFIIGQICLYFSISSHIMIHISIIILQISLPWSFCSRIIELIGRLLYFLNFTKIYPLSLFKSIVHSYSLSFLFQFLCCLS